VAIGQRIQSGSVNVNDMAITYGVPEAPFGGVKESGLGRVQRRDGAQELMQYQAYHYRSLRRRADGKYVSHQQCHRQGDPGYHTRHVGQSGIAFIKDI
jgi:hypothetical protein